MEEIEKSIATPVTPEAAAAPAQDASPGEDEPIIVDETKN